MCRTFTSIPCKGRLDSPERPAVIEEGEPELAIIDIRMPPTQTWEGLEAARAIRAEFPQTGILLLSAHVEIEHATQLLATGQRIGYLLKGRVLNVDEFMESLQRIAAGGSVGPSAWI